ncbi:hypothetical protein BD310DRAFT_823316 [Dichomitus squalens]|uniref:Small secreted protein n=1 Tax=Dichomitus squalens TaxID=114155 RepID=A0A4V2K7L4_9APHY|nr:hypothetical protein BD310DRAFT_823316 [Dichomitus squalens]
MVYFASKFIVVALAGFAAAAPLRLTRRAFQEQDYADFQISDGTAGNAQAEANAVFVDPFDGVDLATVDDATLKAVQTMREAAESAETDQFNPQIDAAFGDEATALQNGKIKNKVLKLTGEIQALNIQLAQAQASGDDTSSIQSKISEEQTKLNNNISLDQKASGQPSKGVTGGSAASSSDSSAAASASDSASAAASTTSAASATKTKAANTKSAKASKATSSAAVATPSAPVDAATGTDGSSISFPVQDYAAFQISDGTAGSAQEHANAVFVDPFAGVDLATVDDSIVENINTMREAAESAETDQFNPAIDAASGADADALQNGKIANKVLKLTGEVQALNIKIAKAQAAGSDTSDLESSLADEQKKLTTNIATDQKHAGEAQKGVA